MSTIHQYLVADELSDSDSDIIYNTAFDLQDPYAEHVVLYYSHTYKQLQYTPPLNGVSMSVMNSGASVSPAHLLSPGKRDFCVEMYFRLPGTYSSELFDELSLIHHPIFVLKKNGGAYGDPEISAYIYNAYIGNNVGLNGLDIRIVDTNNVVANVYISPAQFLAWLNSGSQYKHLSFGRRGKFFFAYLNGELANTVEFASFGEIIMPEASYCHILGVPEHNSLTNFLSAVRMTVGVSRQSGSKAIFIVGQDAPLAITSAPEIRTGGDVKEELAQDQRPRGYAVNLSSPLAGALFDLRDATNLQTRSRWRDFYLCKSQSAPDYLSATVLGSMPEGLNGISVTYGIITYTVIQNFQFFISALIKDELAASQTLFVVETANFVRLAISYNAGLLNIFVYLSNIYGDLLSTRYNQSFALSNKSIVSFGISRDTNGLFVVFEGKSIMISYGGGSQFTRELFRHTLLPNASLCNLLLFYYEQSGFSAERGLELLDFFASKAHPVSTPLDALGFKCKDLFTTDGMFSFTVQESVS